MPQAGRKWRLACDASDVAWGCVLSQRTPRNTQSVAAAKSPWSPNRGGPSGKGRRGGQRNKCRHYLLGSQCEIGTNSRTKGNATDGTHINTLDAIPFLIWRAAKQRDTPFAAGEQKRSPRKLDGGPIDKPPPKPESKKPKLTEKCALDVPELLLAKLTRTGSTRFQTRQSQQ